MRGEQEVHLILNGTPAIVRCAMHPRSALQCHVTHLTELVILKFYFLI